MKRNKFISKLLKYIMKKINYQNFMNLREEYKLKPYAVIKKFYFAMKLLFNILMVRAKYIMLNIYRKEEQLKFIDFGYC